jgi:Tfp pilus assembly protein PilX
MNTSTLAANSYYQKPRFYISDLQTAADGKGRLFQIDAVGFGATANAVAVVESTFEVTTQGGGLFSP